MKLIEKIINFITGLFLPMPDSVFDDADIGEDVRPWRITEKEDD